MVALQIRDVPEDVRDILAERARSRGQSLQAYLLDLVQSDARRARNIAMLQKLSEVGGGLDDDDTDATVQALREEREEREARWTRMGRGGAAGEAT